MTGPPSRARTDPEAKLTGLSTEGGPASRPAPTVSVLRGSVVTLSRLSLRAFLVYSDSRLEAAPVMAEFVWTFRSGGRGQGDHRRTRVRAVVSAATGTPPGSPQKTVRALPRRRSGRPWRLGGSR